MKTEAMTVLTVGGTPRERGRAIGEALREDIQIVSEKHTQSVASRGYSPDEYFAAFDEYADFRVPAQRWAPDLLEEVWGIAEGATILPEAALRLQLLDEDWFFDAYHYAPVAKGIHKCTAFGVVSKPGAATYAGQNMDVPSYTEGHQVLLRIQYPDSDLETLAYTVAGVIVLCGMSNTPIGVNCNTLVQLGSCPDGLPVAFVARSLLAMNSYDDAVAFLNRIRHASGQNYTLSTNGRVGSFECSPNKVVEYRPRADGLRVCHTNHPLANDDTASFELLKEENPGDNWVKGHGNTCSRLASIAARTVNRNGPVTLEDLKEALRAKDDPDNPVCRDLSTDINANLIAYTAGSLIYELTEDPKLHLAAGPPSESEYMSFSISK